MKKKKRKNKKTKVDTSDYYTEVFSKGKKLEEISDKEELTTFKKFRESEYFAPSVFAVVVSIINFTIGIEYLFLFMLAAMCGCAIMAIFIWGAEVFNFGLPGAKNKTVGAIIAGIIGLIIYFLPLILQLIG